MSLGRRGGPFPLGQWSTGTFYGAERSLRLAGETSNIFSRLWQTKSGKKSP